MVTGSEVIGGKKMHFASDGRALSGEVDGRFFQDGFLRTGWIQDNGWLLE